MIIKGVKHTRRLYEAARRRGRNITAMAGRRVGLIMGDFVATEAKSHGIQDHQNVEFVKPMQYYGRERRSIQELIVIDARNPTMTGLRPVAQGMRRMKIRLGHIKTLTENPFFAIYEFGPEYAYTQWRARGHRVYRPWAARMGAPPGTHPFFDRRAESTRRPGTMGAIVYVGMDELGYNPWLEPLVDTVALHIYGNAAMRWPQAARQAVSIFPHARPRS